ncbi:histone acetyltransferase subunit NuA4-domain-containing protein [Gaertneriomyces semiglobifer]|nr:histone acetyltransferase subunit NuA4-domain-containing protein [Gaertneriomyces semiglobifer]
MLAEAERVLSDLMARKKAVDKSLMDLERNIYQYEGSYLEETPHGNIIKGFENYLANKATGSRRSRLNEDDRLFSRSSVTYTKALETVGRSSREDTSEADHDSTYRGTPTPMTSRLDKVKKSTIKSIKRKGSIVTEPETPVPSARKRKAIINDDDD